VWRRPVLRIDVSRAGSSVCRSTSAWYLPPFEHDVDQLLRADSAIFATDEVVEQPGPRLAIAPLWSYLPPAIQVVEQELAELPGSPG